MESCMTSSNGLLMMLSLLTIMDFSDMFFPSL